MWRVQMQKPKKSYFILIALEKDLYIVIKLKLL